MTPLMPLSLILCLEPPVLPLASIVPPKAIIKELNSFQRMVDNVGNLKIALRVALCFVESFIR